MEPRVTQQRRRVERSVVARDKQASAGLLGNERPGGPTALFVKPQPFTAQGKSGLKPRDTTAPILRESKRIRAVQTSLTERRVRGCLDTELL